MLLINLHSSIFYNRRVAILILLLSALLFCFPFLLSFFLNAGFLSLANEPLAYRYFYIERILFGEPLAVGVGYLISILHHFVYFWIHFFTSISQSNLESRLDLFALITNGIISFLLCLILFFASISHRLLTIDLVVLSTLTIVPIYFTVSWGFNYSLSADYNFLNIVICIATLNLFQNIWRYKYDISNRNLILLSIFVGMATANKITMLVVTSVVLVPAIFSNIVDLRVIFKRLILVIKWIILSFFTVHFFSYLGNVSKMRTGLRTWRAWASNPGGEPAFWEQSLSYLINYNYLYLILFSFFILLISIYILFRFSYKYNILERIVTTYCFVAFLACFFFIFKRPAGSTLFESTLFLFTLSTVLLTIFSNLFYVYRFTFFSSFIFIFFSFVTFAYSTNYNLIARSRLDSHKKWSAFYEVLNLSMNKPIEVIFPDNTFHHEGPFELLLKGSSVFPSSWKIDKGQEAILNRYAPFMIFRNNNSEIKPEMPYGGARVLVWFDKVGAESLDHKYIELAKILSTKGVIRISPEFYSDTVNMHIALIP